MADNYLEKKMEEHRQGRQRIAMHKSPSGNKPHTALLPYSLRTAFVAGQQFLSPALVACAKALRDTSCKVAISCSDKVFGSRTAQSSGLQYFPTGININVLDMVNAAYGSLDVIVTEESGVLYFDICGNRSSVSPANGCLDSTFSTESSKLLLYLSLPQSLELRLCGDYLIGSDGRLSEVKD